MNMAKKQTTPRRAAEDRAPSPRQAPPRRASTEKQAASRRSDVIRCENCGEDYSITYKRCPFCDERPGRVGIGGRRMDGGRAPVHPIQLVALVVSMVVIIAAIFIVFKYMGPMLFGNKSSSSSSSSTSQSSSQSSSASSQQPGDASSGGDISQPLPQIPVNSLSLNRSDITLTANEIFSFVATVSPADAPITWTSSNEAVLHVDQNGTMTNVNTTGSKVKVTLTATAGDKTAQCTIYCNSAGSSSVPPITPATPTTPTTPDTPTTPTTPTTSGTIAPNTWGTIVNAGKGLNIRSGPGSSYEKLASASNGVKVKVLEDPGNGWLKIDYGNGKAGYVSKDYVSIP